MLSVKNLTKVYKTSGGEPVRALDDISIDFPEKGMVFLLGRSGSGKSTLLNVAGGLDSPDGGEVIVKGRSSLSFSKQDFDSYRNTFVGFIFQEYNLLNEFTVSENIALAPELQGKPADPAAVEAILHQVDLDGLGRRKPGTLSGGQRQRVAIARALVKNPEIIMADEPTGALDSNTGKQVLDTLKKLSAEKLVILVSHDRDFAEEYGDRIIELSDGKVISDVTKHQVPPRREENITFIGENTVSVKNGTELSEQELTRLTEFIRSAEKPVLLSKEPGDISSFYKANRMTEEGDREEFKPSEEIQPRAYTEEESRFIRSRLPLRHALRIGASGLRIKPFRLVMTVLLSTVAFIMFGLVATLMQFDEKNALNNALDNAEYQGYGLAKNAVTTVSYGETWQYEIEDQVSFSEKEVTRLAEELSAEALAGYRFTLGSQIYLTQNLTEKGNMTDMEFFTGFAWADEKKLSEMGGKLKAGSLPAKPDEICISDFTAELFVRLGYTGSGEVTAIRTGEEMIGKTITVEGYALTVSGIFTSNFSTARYEELEGLSDTEIYAQKLDGLLGLYRTDYSQSIASVFLVSKDFYTEYAPRFGVSEKQEYTETLWEARDITLELVSGSRELFYLSFADMKDMKITALNEKGAITALGENQVLLTKNLLYEIATSLFYAEDYQTSEEELMALDSLFMEGDSDRTGAISILFAALDAHSAEYLGGNWREITITSGADVRKYTVVGTTIAEDLDSGLILSEERAAEIYALGTSVRTEYACAYVADKACVYDFVIFSENANRDALCALHLTEKDENDVIYRMTADVAEEVEEIAEMVRLLKVIFLWTGGILAVFAALLLFNFISVSVSYKRREIGILRAVGARGLDVFKIFFSESAIISGICFVLACIGTVLIAALISNAIMTSLGLRFALFIFGPLQALCILAIALAVSVFGTLLPVSLAARKKPVDAIRSL